VAVRRVVARGHAIEVLPIDLQSRITPLAHEAAHEIECVVDGALIGGAKIETVPPGNRLRRAIFIQQQQIGVVMQQVGARRRGERRPPQPRLETFGADALHQPPHVGFATWILVAIQIPVADIGLPAIIDHRPAQS